MSTDQPGSAEDHPREESAATPAGTPAGDRSGRPTGRPHDGQERSAPTMAESMTHYAQRSGIRRREDGQLDVLHAVGGWRGLTEAILPGAVFLVMFVATQRLGWALVAALVVAALFTVYRLLQRQTLAQAVAGLIGVVVCALVAARSGQAIDYYVTGFWLSGAYGLALLISILVGWPLLGVVFGYIRGEGLEWRAQPSRLRVYRFATALVVLMFAARLLVQLPLYFAENVTWLGITRLVMGVPLYAGILWIGWLISRPAAITPAPQAPGPSAADPQPHGAQDRGPEAPGAPGAPESQEQGPAAGDRQD